MFWCRFSEFFAFPLFPSFNFQNHIQNLSWKSSWLLHFSLYSWYIIYHVSRIEIYHIWYMMYPNILRWILPGHFVIWRNGSEFDKIKEISKDSSSSYPTAENKRTSIVLKHELGPEIFIKKQVSRDKHCDIFQ